jgi:hypothetical protein
MMIVIPTYEVIVDPDDEEARRGFRVPEDKLDAFIQVLNFNHVKDYRVRREGRA